MAREGIHERIQAKVQHEDKKAEVLTAGMYEAPLVWNEVPQFSDGS